MILDKDSKDLMKIYLEMQSKFLQGHENVNEIEAKKTIAVGLISNVIFSRKIFKRNNEIGDFLTGILDISFSKWALSSRTTICGKTVKYITAMDSEEEINNVLNTLYGLFKKVIQDEDVTKKDIYDVIKDMEC